MNEKEKALAAKHGVEKVHELTVYPKEGDPVTVYVKEPTLQALKVAVNHFLNNQMVDCGEVILDTSLIKEESDPRWERSSNKITLCLKAVKIVELASAEQKKSLTNTQ